ncbi:hypothetical protein CN311_08315 [Mesorhizobium sanjuanii]|uniref:DUF2314 domain-containing protein n=1 Tax=Mesorhizobium sanjuanii TaxID=2037900 RepID=A0A2A6FIL2_9HYPH|nr:DUF2314 domain-containing protein [Mesorhizobium sanjuanii]PDQ21664.1 hypothetical protein CN311_08315 [Mesorhizobium sanjuanii]
MTYAFHVILSLMLALAPVSAEAQDPSQGDDGVVAVAPDDPDMAAATAQARASLDEFLALSQTPPPGTDTFKLKVMIKDANVTEHFWVIPFQRTETGFGGILANEPQAVRNVAAGQYIEFNRDDISDWGYTRNGHQVGSFTVCVMFKSMSKQEVDYMRTHYGFDC